MRACHICGSFLHHEDDCTAKDAGGTMTEREQVWRDALNAASAACRALRVQWSDAGSEDGRVHAGAWACVKAIERLRDTPPVAPDDTSAKRVDAPFTAEQVEEEASRVLRGTAALWAVSMLRCYAALLRQQEGK